MPAEGKELQYAFLGHILEIEGMSLFFEKA